MTKLLDQVLFTSVQKSNKSFTPHFHNSYSIGITHKGLFKSFNQNNTFNFYAKSVRVNNPGELHSGDSQSWDNHHMYPRVEFIEDLYFQIYQEKATPVFQKHIIDDIILFEKLKKFFVAFFSKQDNMLLEALIIDALSYMIKNYTTTKKLIDKEFSNKKIITKSIELINDYLLETPSLDILSSNVSLSKYHFLRIFKEETGITPHQYIINQRVEKARNLIENGLPISQAALEVGFNDQSHFNRNFKRIFDFSPTLIAKNRNFILYNK